ncbi:MAG: imidazole glycerol phosphate synthase subunit HisH, partial [Candidatus Omnitrophota bacterium]
LLKGVEDKAWMYFVHSYYVAPRDGGLVAATTDYGVEFTSMIWKDNIYAMQFHPEKSQDAGLKILENFVCL